jgi:hypothetical protein
MSKSKKKVTRNSPTADKSPKKDNYYSLKEKDHQAIMQLISEREDELADLYMRKALLESSFVELLDAYCQFIIPKVPISKTAKTNLLAYFSYELLKPLKTIGLMQTDRENVWKSKHFDVAYELDKNNDLELSFKMETVDTRFEAAYMPLILIHPKDMTVEVDEKQVLKLIHLWHKDKIFSHNQLSLINYDLNQLLAWFKELGFDVAPSLLDNTRALKREFTSDLVVDTKVLDDIFIISMESTEYDFDKFDDYHYQVKLNQSQTVDIFSEKGKTRLFIDSNNRRRSILDFFTNYPFLVPLIVRS